jgi:mycothiol synthase
MRAPTRDDAPAVAEMIAACQRVDGGWGDTTAEEVLGDWETLDLAEEAVVVLAPDRRIVAGADVLNRSYVLVSVYGYVHPDERGRGIGGALVRWGEDWTREHIPRAPADARVATRHYVSACNDSACRLLEAWGYQAVRQVYVMAIDLTEAPPAAEWPDGTRVRTYDPEKDARTTFEAVEDAFRDSWGRPRGRFERFVRQTATSDFDPSLWFLAEAEGQIVGVCLAQVISGRGWIGAVGVRRSWRNRGLGLALMRHVLVAYYRRGVHHVGLSVDSASRTGAPRLYARAGMHVEETYVVYEKELRPGMDLADRTGEE